MYDTCYVCCSVLQCVAVCCSVLQCVSVVCHTHVYDTFIYGVASIRRLLKIIGLFCRISSLLWGYLSKETYNFKEPTNRSHPITIQHTCWRCYISICVYGHLHATKGITTTLHFSTDFMYLSYIYMYTHLFCCVCFFISVRILCIYDVYS